MNYKKYRPLFVALGAGFLGLLLRLILYRIGFDDRNILSASHPLHIACLVLTVVTAGYLLAAVQKLGKTKDPQRNFPDHPLRTAGSLAAGFLMVCYGMTLLRDTGSVLSVLRIVLALGAASAMALQFPPVRQIPALEICRHMVISVFFALDMLCRYRGWSGNPQLPDYVFHVFACVLLTMTGYQRLAFSVGLGKCRSMAFGSLMSLYLCLTCAAGPDTPIFYLGGALWAGSCLGTFRRRKTNRQQHPKQ